MKNIHKSFVACVIVALLSVNSYAQPKIYTANAGEIIFSGSSIGFNGGGVYSNMRFTMFYHSQTQVHFDLTSFMGVYTGLGVRNIGFITEDLYENSGFLFIDNTHPDYGKTVTLKRRSYALGVPFAVKIGRLPKGIHLFAGGEYEWLFHYKQKLFIDGEKFKYSEWQSQRTNPFVPSVFAGIRLPKGINLKIKYYPENFLNPNFVGVDFGEDVDYSTMSTSGMWYLSVATIIGKFNKD